MAETIQSPHKGSSKSAAPAVDPGKTKPAGAPVAAEGPKGKALAKKLQGDRQKKRAEDRKAGGLMRRRLDIAHEPGELYYIRCPRCYGEGAYFKAFPGGRIMGPRDWFTTYKDEGESWQWAQIPCQECWEQGILTPLRIQGTLPPVQVGRNFEPMYLLNGKHTRFIETRSNLDRRERIAQAERSAIRRRMDNIREAVNEVANV